MRIKKHPKLLTLSALLLAFLLLVIPQGLAAVHLNDIQGHWAETVIQTAADQGIIKGYPDGSFKPDNNISRAEFAALTVQAFKKEKKDGKVFGDTSNHWAKDYIATANAHGIVSGYDEQTFGPDGSITREEMALMIVKASGLKVTTGVIDSSDSSKVAAWAKDAVATAYANKLIVGMPDGSFQPQANATRAQAVVVLSKAMQLTEEKIDVSEAETPSVPTETPIISSNSSGGGSGGSGSSGAVVINDIEVLTEPDKIVYNAGDPLDLAGLSVILYYSDASTVDVILADFAAKGITTSPADGEVLNTSHSEVTISVKGKSISQPITVKSAGTISVANVSSETRTANVNWYRFNVKGAYKNLQLKTTGGQSLGAVTSRSEFETAGFYQGMASPDNIIVIYVDGIERYRGIPETYSTDMVTVTNVSSEARAANVNWYRFNVNGTYNNVQIKTADGQTLGAVTDQAEFETAGFYQGMASPNNIIVIYVDGIERYRGIPETYSTDMVTVTNVSSEARAANVNWYRFLINGTYNNVQIKTAEDQALGGIVNKIEFEKDGFYQGMASPDKIIVIYVDGIERYRGIPADYSPGGAVIIGISVKNGPDKTTYKEGDSLDITGLVVTIAKSDGASQDIAWNDFTVYGITTSPVHGALLTTADKSIVITVEGKTAIYSMVVESETPTIVTVTDVTVDKYYNGLMWNENLYRFTVNGDYDTVQLKTADGTSLGIRISRAAFESQGYYLGSYFEGTATLDSIIVIYVDGVERYRGIPNLY